MIYDICSVFQEHEWQYMLQIMVGIRYYDIKLTHWGRVMHICICKLTIINSDNGLSPGRRKAII